MKRSQKQQSQAHQTRIHEFLQRTEPDIQLHYADNQSSNNIHNQMPNLSVSESMNQLVTASTFQRPSFDPSQSHHHNHSHMYNVDNTRISSSQYNSSINDVLIDSSRYSEDLSDVDLNDNDVDDLENDKHNHVSNTFLNQTAPTVLPNYLHSTTGDNHQFENSSTRPSASQYSNVSILTDLQSPFFDRESFNYQFSAQTQPHRKSKKYGKNWRTKSRTSQSIDIDTFKYNNNRKHKKVRTSLLDDSFPVQVPRGGRFSEQSSAEFQTGFGGTTRPLTYSYTFDIKNLNRRQNKRSSVKNDGRLKNNNNDNCRAIDINDDHFDQNAPQTLTSKTNTNTITIQSDTASMKHNKYGLYDNIWHYVSEFLVSTFTFLFAMQTLQGIPMEILTTIWQAPRETNTDELLPFQTTRNLLVPILSGYILPPIILLILYLHFFFRKQNTFDEIASTQSNFRRKSRYTKNTTLPVAVPADPKYILEHDYHINQSQFQFTSQNNVNNKNRDHQININMSQTQPNASKFNQLSLANTAPLPAKLDNTVSTSSVLAQAPPGIRVSYYIPKSNLYNFYNNSNNTNSNQIRLGLFRQTIQVAEFLGAVILTISRLLISVKNVPAVNDVRLEIYGMGVGGFLLKILCLFIRMQMEIACQATNLAHFKLLCHYYSIKFTTILISASYISITLQAAGNFIDVSWKGNTKHNLWLLSACMSIVYVLLSSIILYWNFSKTKISRNNMVTPQVWKHINNQIMFTRFPTLWTKNNKKTQNEKTESLKNKTDKKVPRSPKTENIDKQRKQMMRNQRFYHMTANVGVIATIFLMVALSANPAALVRRSFSLTRNMDVSINVFIILMALSMLALLLILHVLLKWTKNSVYWKYTFAIACILWSLFLVLPQFTNQILRSQTKDKLIAVNDNEIDFMFSKVSTVFVMILSPVLILNLSILFAKVLIMPNAHMIVGLSIGTLLVTLLKLIGIAVAQPFTFGYTITLFLQCFAAFLPAIMRLWNPNKKIMSKNKDNNNKNKNNNNNTNNHVKNKPRGTKKRRSSTGDLDTDFSPRLTNVSDRYENDTSNLDTISNKQESMKNFRANGKSTKHNKKTKKNVGKNNCGNSNSGTSSSSYNGRRNTIYDSSLNFQARFKLMKLGLRLSDYFKHGILYEFSNNREHSILRDKTNILLFLFCISSITALLISMPVLNKQWKDDAPELTLATYNVHLGYNRLFEFAIEDMANEVDTAFVNVTSEIDVLCLQEVGASNWEMGSIDILDYFGNKLGFPYGMYGAPQISTNGFNVALLSKYPLANVFTVSKGYHLPNPDYQSNLIVAEIDIQNAKQNPIVMCTHLKTGNEKSGQADAIMNLAQNYSQHPVFIMGDFNAQFAPCDNKHCRRLLYNEPDNSDEFVMTDPFEQFFPWQELKRMSTIASGDRIIDNVLYRQEFAQLQSIEIALNSQCTPYCNEELHPNETLSRDPVTNELIRNFTEFVIHNPDYHQDVCDRCSVSDHLAVKALYKLT